MIEPIKPLKRVPLIALIGHIKSGKSTAASALCAKRGYTELSFAEPLKRVVEWLWDCDARTQEGKARILSNGRSVRNILEQLGTEGFRRVDPNVWVNFLERELREVIEAGTPGVVIPDMRYMNEAALVERYAGFIVRLTRTGYVPQRTGHASDTEWERIVPDLHLEIPDGEVGLIESLISYAAGSLEGALALHSADERFIVEHRENGKTLNMRFTPRVSPKVFALPSQVSVFGYDDPEDRTSPAQEPVGGDDKGIDSDAWF